jgi:hypothetical protein
MTPAMDVLLTEDSLYFTPLTGTFDVEAVAEAISKIGFPYRDEIDPSAFAIFSKEEDRDACRAARRADPTSTFPYVLLATVRPTVVAVFPMASQEDIRVLSIQFLEWLMANYECRIENEFGTDMASLTQPKENPEIETPDQETPADNSQPSN